MGVQTNLDGNKSNIEIKIEKIDNNTDRNCVEVL